MTEEEDYLLRICLALYQSYIEYLIKPEEKIKLDWNLKIKPLLLKKYHFQKDGIFTVNADVEFLIKEVDKINMPQIQISEEENCRIRNKLNDIRMNTIYISSKHIMKYNKPMTNTRTYKDNKIFNNNKIIPENKGKKNNQINKANKKPLKKVESAMDQKLNKNKKDEQRNIILEIEKEFDIMNEKKRNNSTDEQKRRKITLTKPYDPYKYVNEIDNNNNNNENEPDKKKEENTTTQDNSKKEKEKEKEKEMSVNYIDELDSESTIKYKGGEIKQISFDLLLKKIATSDFFDKHINKIYNFSQQCFCFIQAEILFQKIINCYNFLKKVKVPYIHARKLIYFFDLLLVEMCEYYHYRSLPSPESSIITKFFNDLEEEITKKKEEEKKKEKKISHKIDEKIKLMGQIFDRPQPPKPTVSQTNRNSRGEEVTKTNEEEMLVEIQYLMNFTKEDAIDHNSILAARSICNFYKIRTAVNKSKKENKNVKIQSTKKLHLVKLEEKITRKIGNDNYFCVLDWEPKDIGEALINISKKDLNKIERKELLKAIFLKKIKNKECPNVMECINKFNKLAWFIIEEILSYDFPKDRAKIYEGWVRVAEYLKFRKDHNDCFAIYSALNNFIITGLKQTMKEIKAKTKAIFKEISEYCNFVGNYKNLREDIIYCLNNCEFYIPYLGMLLRDISFLESNFQYLLNGKLINIEKIEKVQITFNTFFAYKHFNDSFNKNNEYPKKLEFFDDLELLKEDNLDILANKLEPKFILTDTPRKKKRLTNIDRKYFLNNNSNVKNKKDKMKHDM